MVVVDLDVFVCELSRITINTDAMGWRFGCMWFLLLHGKFVRDGWGNARSCVCFYNGVVWFTCARAMASLCAFWISIVRFRIKA